MTITRVNASDPRGMQQFVEQVVKALTGPKNGAITWSYTRDFIWKPSLDTTVDVDLGTTVKPKGLLVLQAEEEAEDRIVSGCRIVWSWRSGYARVSAVDNIDITVSNPSNWRVTIGVIL